MSQQLSSAFNTQFHWCRYVEALDKVKEKDVCRRQLWMDTNPAGQPAARRPKKVIQRHAPEPAKVDVTSVVDRQEENDEDDDLDHPSKEETGPLTIEGFYKQEFATSVEQFFQDMMASIVAYQPSDVEIDVFAMTGQFGYDYNIPCTRSGATLTACAEFGLVLFGGRFRLDETSVVPRTLLPTAFNYLSAPLYYCNQTHRLDMSTSVWDTIRCKGEWPAPRSDHAAVFVPPHNLFIFGGRGKQGHVLNDMHVLDLRTWTWRPIICPKLPSSRYWHSMVYCEERHEVILFGGRDADVMYGDLHCFDIDLFEQVLAGDTPKNVLSESIELWKEPLTFGEPARHTCGSRMLPLSGHKILFLGGWHYQPAADPRHTLIEMKVLDLETKIWVRPHIPRHAVIAEFPCDRFFFQCFRRHNIVYLFGGYRSLTYGRNAFRNDKFKPLQEPFIYRYDLLNGLWSRQRLEHPLPICRAEAGNAVFTDGRLYCFKKQPDRLHEEMIRFRITEEKRVKKRDPQEL